MTETLSRAVRDANRSMSMNSPWTSSSAWPIVMPDSISHSMPKRERRRRCLRDAKAGKAAIVKAGNVVFALEDDGELLVLQDSLTAFEPLRRYKLAEAKTWTQPVISENRVFVKDVASLALWTLN